MNDTEVAHGDVTFCHKYETTYWRYEYDNDRLCPLHVYRCKFGRLELVVDIEALPSKENLSIGRVAVWRVIGIDGHQSVGVRESLEGGFESACANAMNLTPEEIRLT